MSLTPTDDDFLQNRDGRMTDTQRGIVLAQSYGSMGCAALLILVATPLVVLGISRLANASGIGALNLIFDVLLPLVGALALLWLTLAVGWPAYLMMRDGLRGAVERDCGIVTVETRRTGTSLSPTAYVVVDGERYYSTTSITQRGIETGARCCVYYTPRTRAVVSVEYLT